MTDEGPVLRGTGPSLSEEEARRRLYRPGGASDGAVERYRALRDAPVSPTVPRSATVPTPGRAGPIRRVGVLVMVAGIAGLAGGVAAPLPHAVPVPALAGSVLAVLGRGDDSSAGAAISYQPQGYSVFQPDGRPLGIALTCIGTGTVTIGVGSEERFACGSTERRQIRLLPPRTAPFVVMGTTVGQVVWSARIVSRPR